MCCFSAGNRHLSEIKSIHTLRSESKPATPTFCVYLFFFFLERHFLMRRFKTLASAWKCPEMPKHMLTIHTFALFPVSTTVRNLSSSIVQRFIGTNSRKKFIVWYLLLRVKVHLSWTKLGLADPFLRNRNFVFRCGMHIGTLPVQMTDFQLLSAEVVVTWQKGRHIWSGSIG